MQDIQIKDLQISPFNVRKSSDKISDEQLKASLLAHGLLQNLTVQELDGKYYVIAGGRRLKMLKELVKDGSLAGAHTVPCEVVDDSISSTELSLAENVMRLAMHPIDEYEAYAAMQQAGAVSSQIAVNFGVTEKHVESRLRMSRIDPAVLKALRDNKISLEQAMAFAVTNDKKRQVRALKEVREHTSAKHIKNTLTEGLIAHDSNIGKYIGKEAYIKAGGTIREDLLGEMFWFENTELVKELVAKKMKPLIDKLTGEGWGWVEFVPEREWEYTNSMGRNWDKNPPKKLKALMGCILGFNYEDKLQASTGYIRKADAANYRAAQPKEKGSSKSENMPKGREKGALTILLTESLTRQRKVIMQYALAANPSLAADFLLYSMIESLLKKDGVYNAGVRGLNITFRDMRSKETVKDSGGIALSAVWDDCVKLMQRIEKNKGAAHFEAYCHFTTEEKMKLMGLCTGLCVEGTLADAMNNSVIESVLGYSRVNVRTWWRPTKDNYLGSITREQLVELTISIFGKAVGKEWENAKKPELVKMLDEAFAKPEKHKDNPPAMMRLESWTPANFAFKEEGKRIEKPKGKKAA